MLFPRAPKAEMGSPTGVAIRLPLTQAHGGPALRGRRVSVPQRAQDPPATLWTLAVDLPNPVGGPHLCPADRGLVGRLSEPPACEE